MPEVMTRFGSLEDYEKGGVERINDDVRYYVFSNVFAVAKASAPHERVAVGINFVNVLETARAEGTLPWFTCAHDEFGMCMGGEVEVHLIKLTRPEDDVDPEHEGAMEAPGSMPDGRKMGRLLLGRGHRGLLPVGAAPTSPASTVTGARSRSAIHSACRARASC